MSRFSLRLAPVLLVPALIALAWHQLGQARPDIAATKRVPWTSSKVVGQPDPPFPYKLPVAFPNLKFDHPLLMVAMPGSDLLFVGEQAGKIFSFPNRPEAKAELFVDLPKELKRIAEHKGAKEFENLYGMAFHPQFEKNRQCFICYTLRGKKGKTGPFNHEQNLPEGSRVSRFTVTNTNPPRLEAASEEIILAYLQGGHNGGDLHFGPDGYLYITTGDSTNPNPPDVFRTGQDITDLESSVLRIDIDHKDPGKNYAIPKDNPFLHTQIEGKPARPEVWAYGFRNPWRMSFDRKTGDLWLGDVGWERWEMVHKIEKGGNYGWSVMEARQPINHTWPIGPTPIRPPVIELDHAIAASVTGGYVYRGKKHPELVGKYIFGDWETRRFWAAKCDGDRLVSMDELTDPRVRIVAFGQTNEGELYALDYDNGKVHELKPSGAIHDPTLFPRTLSRTGLFNSVREHTPATGVYPFEVASPLWSDGATAVRWAAFPDSSSVIDNEVPKPVPGDVYWHNFKYHFPKGTVLLKTLSLPDSRRIETQLLHFDGENWRGYSYAWREDQSDADLVASDGQERVLQVADPKVAGGKREWVWNFHSRQQCSQCHHAWSEYANAFNTVQLNRSVTVNGHSENQLQHFQQLGLITRHDKQDNVQPPMDADALKKQPKIVDPRDKTAALNERARAYFHANCGHCHIFGGGGTVDLELHQGASIDSKKLIDAAATRGTFDIEAAKLISPGHPERSVLYYRMAKFGAGRMPHLGSEMVDTEAVQLVYEWIRKMKPEPVAKDSLEQSFTTVSKAVSLANELHNGCPQDRRDEILQKATALPSGNVRDLFEGFLPSDGKPRKLGSNPRPGAILGLTGDVERGKALFVATRSQCLNCHKFEDKGNEIGPDLASIGKTRTREFLLESLIDPSRRVEPPFQMYLVRTLSGQALTGIIIKRDDKQVVLKDAQNKTNTILVTDLESLSPARQSMMPDGQLRDFTAQEAADLLAFLQSLKK